MELQCGMQDTLTDPKDILSWNGIIIYENCIFENGTVSWKGEHIC